MEYYKYDSIVRLFITMFMHIAKSKSDMIQDVCASKKKKDIFILFPFSLSFNSYFT